MMQKQKSGSTPAPAPKSSAPKAAGAAPHNAGTKPSDVLPLDDDERGYGNF